MRTTPLLVWAALCAAAPLHAQDVQTSISLDRPLVMPPEADGSTFLWRQNPTGLNAYIDQVFSDATPSSSYQVVDVSTEGEVWNVELVSTWFTKGATPSSDWSAAPAITQASLNVYPKTGMLPDDAEHVPPMIVVDAVLVDLGTAWRVDADTSEVPELQCVSGDFWIGLTPHTTFSAHGQEFHTVSNDIEGDETAFRNPGNGFPEFTSFWMQLSELDEVPAGPYEASIALQGEVLAPLVNVIDTSPPDSEAFAGPAVASFDGIACAGQTVTVGVTSLSEPFDLGTLVIGASNLSAPFKNGTMVPNPDFLVSLPLGAAGDFSLPTAWPEGIPPGFALYLQWWAKEDGATNPGKWRWSDGLEVIGQ